MKPLYWLMIAALIGLLHAGCANNKNHEKKFSAEEPQKMPFNYPQYATAEDAKAGLQSVLPQGSSVEHVLTTLNEMGFDVYEMHNNSLPARFVEPSQNMVKVVWRLKIEFNEDNQLADIKVSRGLVGP